MCQACSHLQVHVHVAVNKASSPGGPCTSQSRIPVPGTAARASIKQDLTYLSGGQSISPHVKRPYVLPICPRLESKCAKAARCSNQTLPQSTLAASVARRRREGARQLTACALLCSSTRQAQASGTATCSTTHSRRSRQRPVRAVPGHGLSCHVTHLATSQYLACWGRHAVAAAARKGQAAHRLMCWLMYVCSAYLGAPTTLLLRHALC